jgi:phosphatidylserine/phosphatidylglycerophosphate/cardiolipin synthase-like enzyme
MEIVLCLSKATHKIDLCVFEFTQFDLADFLISLKNRGVRVKVITDAHRDRRQPNNDAGGDQRQQQGINNQIPKLQSARIPVRVNRSRDRDRALMHNKFVLIDDNHLIMGSFNWTQNAVKWNHEAVISTNESRVVKKFVREFETIWDACEDRERELPVIRVR